MQRITVQLSNQLFTQTFVRGSCLRSTGTPFQGPRHDPVLKVCTITFILSRHVTAAHVTPHQFVTDCSLLPAICCFRWHLYDLLANRSAWWAPGKTLELRRRLKPYWQVGLAVSDACAHS